jgi:hypothetical protein
MLPKRKAPIEMQGSEFNQTGYQLTDQIPDFIHIICTKPVTTNASSTQLNELLLNGLQRNEEVFLSNAVVGGKYCLRACMVNFRTSELDIEVIVEIILNSGRKVSEFIKNKSV